MSVICRFLAWYGYTNSYRATKALAKLDPQPGPGLSQQPYLTIAPTPASHVDYKLAKWRT